MATYSYVRNNGRIGILQRGKTNRRWFTPDEIEFVKDVDNELFSIQVSNSSYSADIKPAEDSIVLDGVTTEAGLSLDDFENLVVSSPVFLIASGTGPTPSVDINQYFDHRYRASNARKANDELVVNNDFPEYLKDEIGTVDLPLETAVSSIGTSNHLTGETIPFRSQFGGYVQMYNQTGSYFGGQENVIGEKPFPRYKIIVGLQAKYNTYEMIINPYRGTTFGDDGDDWTRIEGGSHQYNPTIGIPVGFPIRQAYLLEIIETLVDNGPTVLTKVYFNGEFAGENTGGVDANRQISPVLQVGANTNNANWGCIEMLQKWGVPTEEEIEIIRTELFAKYKIGQRINAPLALDLLAVKDGTNYTASWNYSPNPATQLPMQGVNLKWVIYKEPDGVQSSIYFDDVENLTTWNSETYPLPSGFSVRGVEAIVIDTAGNFCNIPERVNTSLPQ